MDIKNVAVLGAGTMGAGIAQVSALVGCKTTLFDIDDDKTAKGLVRIEKSLQKGVTQALTARDETFGDYRTKAEDKG